MTKQEACDYLQVAYVPETLPKVSGIVSKERNYQEYIQRESR